MRHGVMEIVNPSGAEVQIFWESILKHDYSGSMKSTQWLLIPKTSTAMILTI